MLEIFICEDNTEFRRSITQKVQSHIIIEDYNMTVACSTGNPNDILDYLSKHPETYGVYFLDVDLKCEMNGIELASKIREIDRLGKIVFITTHSEALRLTFKYKVEAMDYLLKEETDILDEGIYSALQHAQMHYSENSHTFNVKIGSELQLYKMVNVMFIETSPTPHKLILHLKNGSVEFTGKITDVCQQSPLLIQIHKSFVVHLDAVQSVDKKERLVYLTNGECCSVSQRKIKLLNNLLTKKQV